MRVLAIESSGRESSVAALEGNGGESRLLNDALVSGSRRTAQTLAPTLKHLLASVAWPAESIELVVVAVGPGSFTGLRIGVTTAKTLAYAVGAEVVAVNTLVVLAEQATESDRPLWAVMDAQREELFAAKFVGPAGGRAITVDTRIVSQAEWLASLQPRDLVTGPALSRLQTQLPAGVESADGARWQPRAATVGQVGWREYQAGRRDDLWKLVPQYYRLSAAEETMSDE